MIRKKHFVVDLGTYPFSFTFSFGETDKELFPQLSKIGIDDKSLEICKMTKNTLGRTVLFNTHHTLIRMTNIPKNYKDFGTLHHEIFHAVTFILGEVIGIDFILEKSDEAYAYLIGYVTEQVYKNL